MINEKTYLIKLTINNILNLVVTAEEKSTYLMTDNELAKLLEVSRTTIREALQYLCDKQIIERTKQGKTILRTPTADDFYDIDSCEPSKDSQIETFFMNLLMSGELKPGDKFFELELSKQSGCTTITVREFLNRFANNGLIEKIPRSGWRVVELDESLILELIEFKRILEMSSINKLLQLSPDNPIWEVFREILIQHQNVRDNFAKRHGEFQQLEKQFHGAIQQVSKNRFTNRFFDLVLFVRHYYFLWGNKGKLTGIKIAIEQQIELLTHLLRRDVVNAVLTVEKNLFFSQESLLNSVKNLNTKQ